MRFPLSGSWTTGATIDVRGTTSDAEADEIISVTVNGVPALTDDGFATWRVPDLAVQAGANTLEGLVQDAQGNVGTFSLVIEQGESPGTLLVSPGGMAFDPNNGRPRLLVPDRELDALLAVDLSEGPGRGHRSIISRSKSGDEDRFLVPRAVALDAGNERALVVDSVTPDAGKLFAVDLASGERDPLVEGLRFPNSIAVASDGNRVLLGDLNAVLAVNLSTTPPSIDPVVDIPPYPVSIHFDPRNTNRALVVANVNASLATKTLFEVDIAGKTTTKVADFFDPRAVTFYPDDSSRALVLGASAIQLGRLLNPGALFEINLGNGAESLLSGMDASDGSIKGRGPRFSTQNGAGVVSDPADSGRVYAHGGHDSNRIFSVDLATGDRIALERSLGDGPEFVEPIQVALIPGASPDQPPMAVVLDKVVRDLGGASADTGPSDSIYRVSLAAGDNLGDRVFLSGFDADNPNQPPESIKDPFDMVVDTDNRRVLVMDNRRGAIVAVDLETGERTIFSENNGVDDGDGPGFCNMTGIVLDPEKANKRALVATCGALFAVDLDSGVRSILSGANIGSGPALPDPRYINVPLALAANNRVLVVTGVKEDEKASLMAVELETGKRTIISNKGLGSGPEIQVPESLSFDAVGNRALILDSERNSIFAVDLDTGDRSIMSGIGPGPDQKFGGGDDELVGGGAAFNERAKLSDAVLDADGQVLYVTDRATGSLIAVDLATGDRVLVSGFAF